jgi:hypothetical protein
MALVADVLVRILGYFLEPPWGPIAAQVCRAWHQAFQSALSAREPQALPPWRLRAGDYVTTRALVEWARANGAAWSATIVTAAAARGDLEMLRWATDAGAPWQWRVCADAAARGDLRVLRFASSLGVPLTSSICAHAAFAGQVDVLDWAVAAGAPWSAATVCLCAKWGTRAGVLRWLVLSRESDMWCFTCCGRPTVCASCSRYMWVVRSVGAEWLESELRAAGFQFGSPHLGAGGSFDWRPEYGEALLWVKASAPRSGVGPPAPVRPEDGPRGPGD